MLVWLGVAEVVGDQLERQIEVVFPEGYDGAAVDDQGAGLEARLDNARLFHRFHLEASPALWVARWVADPLWLYDSAFTKLLVAGSRRFAPPNINPGSALARRN